MEPFCSRIYKSDEDALLDTSEDEYVHVSLKTKFYELRFRGMREKAVQDLIDRYQNGMVHAYKDIVREDAIGLDGIYILDKSYTMELIAVKDNRIMYVNYDGHASLEAVIEEIGRKIDL